MSRLTQSELINNGLKEALHREEQRQSKYSHLSKTIKDQSLKAMFTDFELTSRERVALLKVEMKKFNIK